MSKYKTGDKFIIEIEETICGYGNNPNDTGHITEPLHRIKGFNALVFDGYGLDKLQKINPQLKIEDIDDMLTEYELGKASYENGLYAGWNLSKKLFSEMSDTELNKIFGIGWSYPKLMELKPHEVLEKIENYERSQIQVGDIVESEFNTKKYIVINNKTGAAISIDLRETTRLELSYWEKTGRHIDISHILEQIRGE